MSAGDAERGRARAEDERQAAEGERQAAEKVRDSWWHRNMGAIVGFLCGAVFALVILMAIFVKSNRDTIHKVEIQADNIQREGVERRDQSCRGWEKVHAQEIRDLKRSYAFYAAPNPPPSLKDLLENPISLSVLRERIRDAKDDRDQYGQFVPGYCDEPGVKAERLFKRTHGKRGRPPVGANEPDPKVPKMPPSVEKLLERADRQFQAQQPRP